MPKYRAYVTVNQYRAFEFEADDEILAYDHMEHMINHYQGRLYMLLDTAEETGPDEITIQEIEEI